MKPILIDFEDSFTLNIASELFRQDVEVEVVHYQNYFTNYSSLNVGNQKIILGPGPGHPQEYFDKIELREGLSSLLDKKSNRIVGICLGHQLLGLTLGLKVVESMDKYHGVAVRHLISEQSRCFPNSLFHNEIYLQRYNSLALKIEDDSKLLNSHIFFEKDKNNEIICLRSNQFLSYQFHPESIGTFYRDEIFSYIKEYLYNH